jgi:endonuclease/exonuclease/phosphatase family metal-dependent hydrolase
MSLTHLLGRSLVAAFALTVAACSAGADEADAVDSKITEQTSIWSSPEACDAALAQRAHQAHEPGAARIATWNIRWFPDGVMPAPDAVKKPTNIPWLACSIAWLDVDVLVVEEILTHPEAQAAMTKLTAEISRLTGGDWRSEIDPCPHPNSQHQGYLYDARRVSLAGVHDFNWRDGDQCNLSRRPGLAAHVKFATGLDLHMVAVHQKSGVDAWSYQTRQEALGRLPALYTDAQENGADPDVLVAGDFNTMGCTHSPCEGVDAVAEATELGHLAEQAGFTRLTNDQTCSEYSGPTYRKLLDHYLASSALRDAVHGDAKLSGYCADLGCGPMKGGIERAQVELSDHCPLLLDLSREPSREAK